MNLIRDELLELIQQPVAQNVVPIEGDFLFQTRVVPREDIDDDKVDRYWRLFGKYPNDFAAAVNKLLPKGVRFITYNHLNNLLTYEQG